MKRNADKHEECALRRWAGSVLNLLAAPRLRVFASARRQRGFTLIELVMTIAILTILTLGVIPLVKLSVKRQKEQHLREALREMRTAIDQFHREALVGRCGQGTAGNVLPPQQPNQPPGQSQQQQILDPRIKVAISDCTIFNTDNPDRYPPDLETLVKGVNVVPVNANPLGGRGDPNVRATDVGSAELSTKKKVYLRRIPVDPMTGEADWEFRSSYDAVDAGSWGGENVFDVRSKSTGTALNGEKYSDW
jgi:general secretion pathway protein G